MERLEEKFRRLKQEEKGIISQCSLEGRGDGKMTGKACFLSCLLNSFC